MPFSICVHESYTTKTLIADLEETYELVVQEYEDTLERYANAYEADSLDETAEGYSRIRNADFVAFRVTSSIDCLVRRLGRS
ncbi:hypothetical protein [Natrialba taiwanensis]|uniref:Uncharacterized protein n=1 Tax=Natrialba taiwanensis DSM 12281 TaxID=1230458 RepID=M0A859_9EURY|nr:hypothetical protein [Natrialba taiwanensis]ELY94541.1 hypothetical protein C484_06192 [Natrialba taiwanensis DSM 12281]